MVKNQGLVQTIGQSMPINLLYQNHKYFILKTRKSLFHRLDQNSLALGSAAKGILNTKLRESKTLFGEILPWLIADVLGVEKEKMNNLAEGWLAMYLYTIYIDSCIDESKKLNEKELLASSLLAKEGIVNLHKIVLGTKYETIFNTSLDRSLTFQLKDYLNKSDVSNIREKKIIAREKNRVSMACAAAIAASHPTYGDFIIKFSNSLLLTIQLLDDISDFSKDYKDRNYSYLLTLAMQKNFVDNLRNKKQILDFLIKTGAFGKVIKLLVSSLKNLISILEDEITQKIDLSSVLIVYQLELLFASLLKDVNYLERNYENLDMKDKQGLLRRVEQKIMYAQTTT